MAGRLRGRTVCIGSMGCTITSPTMGPYTMSQHALEAHAECLRQELAQHGLAVSIVQPGAVETDIGANGEAASLARLAATPASSDTLAQSLRTPVAPDSAAPESAPNRRFARPEALAAVVLEALFAAAPQACYLVGTRWESDREVDAMITRLIDAAHSPSQGMDDAMLLARLCAASNARGA